MDIHLLTSSPPATKLPSKMQACIKKDEQFWQSLTGGHQDRGLPDAVPFLLTKLRKCNHNTAVNTLLSLFLL